MLLSSENIKLLYCFVKKDKDLASAGGKKDELDKIQKEDGLGD